MNSTSHLTATYFILAALSSTPSLQGGEDENRFCHFSSCTPVAINCEVGRYQQETISYIGKIEQYSPKTDYKSRYKRIASSEKFRNAYVNKSLGESISIDD